LIAFFEEFPEHTRTIRLLKCIQQEIIVAPVSNKSWQWFTKWDNNNQYFGGIRSATSSLPFFKVMELRKRIYDLYRYKDEPKSWL